MKTGAVVYNFREILAWAVHILAHFIFIAREGRVECGTLTFVAIVFCQFVSLHRGNFSGGVNWAQPNIWFGLGGFF